MLIEAAGRDHVSLATRREDGASVRRPGLGALSDLAPVPGHPQPLMFAAFRTHAPRYIRRICPVLKIISTGSHQGSIQRRRPLRIGLGEPPHLARGKSKITKHAPEQLAGIDQIEELLPHLERKPRLRFRPFPGPRNVAVRSSTNSAAAAIIPSCCAAMRSLGSATASRLFTDGS
jgi:hypothetical protein